MTTSTNVERRRLRARRALFAITTALCSGLAAPAIAQTIGEVAPPPDRSTVDQNGVDVLSLQPSFSDVDISVGPGGPGGGEFRRYNGIGGNNSEFASITHFGGGVTVVVDGVSEKFWLQSDGSYATQDGDGATLVVGANNTYTFTGRDGKVATFDNVLFNPFVGSSGYLSSITSPNGEKTTVSNRTDAIWVGYWQKFVSRVSSTVTNQGYMLKFRYATDVAADQNNLSDWGRVISVTAVNLAADYCDPAANACTVSGSMRSATYTMSVGSGTVTATATDPLNRTTTYIKSASAFRIRRPGSSADNVVYNFGSASLVSSVVRDGVTYSYAYSDATSGSTTTRTTTVTDPNGNTRVYIGDPAKNLLSSFRDELYHTTAYAYDANRRLTQVTYPEGNKTTYTYDGRGNVIETRQIAKTPGTPADIVTSAGYDAICANTKTCNKPNWTRDARGNQTDYTYDGATGNLLTVTAPAATAGGIRSQTRYSYTAQQAYYKNSAGSVVASGAPIYVLTGVSACQTTSSCVGTADETKTSLGYGPQSAGTPNNLMLVSASAGAGDGSLTATSTFTYDNDGNRTSVDGPLSGSADTTRTLYNADRQVVGAIGPDPDGAGARVNRAQRITYGADGQPTKVEIGTTAGQSDASWAAFSPSQQAIAGYDGNGRKTTDIVKDAGGTTYGVTQYSYDALGRPECIAVRMNSSAWGSLPSAACTAQTAGGYGPDRIAKTSYDAASEVTKVQTAYGVTGVQADEVTSTYNSNGTTATVTDAEGNKTTYEYDGVDRLVKTRYPSTTTGAGTSSTTDYEQLTFDAGGNVTSRRLRDGTSIGYSFDALNRMTLMDLNGNGIDQDISYTYDLMGRKASATNPWGHVTYYGYDALGRVTVEGTTFGGNKASTYDLAGRRTRLTWSDSFYVDYDYDVTGNMTVVRENGATSGVGVLATYAYDDLGRRTSLTRGNGVVTSYGYDAISRLTSLASDLAGSTYDVTTTLVYNPAGQITSTTRSNDAYAWTGATNVNRGYTTNGLNQYSASGSVALGYDANGNLNGSGSTSYSYSQRNQLYNYTGASGWLFYDPPGRLDYSGSTGTTFDYDGDRLVTEGVYGGASVARRYVFGAGTDEPLVWYEGSGTSDRRWLVADERGSIVAVTNASGAATAINTYDESGIPGASNSGRFQYTGQAWLPELGMYYYKARMYSPTLGRFMQTDPIGYGDGMNWYNYVGSDPVNASDPSGTVTSPYAPAPSPCSPDGTGDIIVCANRPRGFNPENYDMSIPTGMPPWQSNSANQTTPRPAGPTPGQATPQRANPVCAVPPGGPGKAKLDADIRQSLALNAPMSFFDYGMSPGEKADWLIDKVRDGGAWDFKTNPAYPKGRAFGDFHYGAVASALFGSHAATYGAHLYSLLRHGEMEDQMANVRAGYAYVANGCYKK